jgi:hypothetical protein
MKQWPKDGKPVLFSDIADPLVQAMADAVGNGMVRAVPVKRRGGYAFRSNTSDLASIDYHGYDIGEDDKATCNSPEYRLSGEGLRFDWTDQGRTPAEVIIGLAVQLGIEQGRRIERERSEAGQTLDLIRRLISAENASRTGKYEYGLALKQKGN